MAGSTYEQKQRLLQHHHLLGKLSAGEIDRLLAFSRVERYPAGGEIFAKGAPGNNLMAVMRGSVRISSLAASGREIVLNIIGAGEIFGEIALLDGGPRTAGATAASDSELLVIARRDLMPVLEARPDICLLLLQMVCQRLRRTSEQVEDLLFLHLQSRIAKALLQLAGHEASRPGQVAPDPRLRLSQQELGNIVGASRESVNRQLQLLHRSGLIKLDRGTIVIRDADAFARLL